MSRMPGVFVPGRERTDGGSVRRFAASLVNVHKSVDNPWIRLWKTGISAKSIFTFPFTKE